MTHLSELRIEHENELRKLIEDHEAEVAHLTAELARRDVEAARLKTEMERMEDGHAAVCATLDSYFHLACDAAGIEDGSQVYRASLLIEMAKRDDLDTPLQRALAELERLQPLRSVLRDWDWSGIMNEAIAGEQPDGAAFLAAARAFAHVEAAEAKAKKAVGS